MFLYKLKVCGNNLASSKYIGAILPKSLYHTLVILAVFQTFSLLLCLLWWLVICDQWSVIGDLWCYYHDFLKAYKMVRVLAIKSFLIKVLHWFCFFFRHNALMHFIDYSKYNFDMHWEAKNSWLTLLRYLLYYSSLEQNYNASKVCLCVTTLSLQINCAQKLRSNFK